MPLFQFNLNTMQITDTRSTHKDTDWVSFTLKVGSAQAVSTSRPMGDLNNGIFDIGLSFSGTAVNPNDTVVLNYLIINAGGPSSGQTIQDTLNGLGVRLASNPTFNLPPLTSSLELIASKFYQELGPIINEKSCDGLVAAEQNTFSIWAIAERHFRIPLFHANDQSHGGHNTRLQLQAIRLRCELEHGPGGSSAFCHQYAPRRTGPSGILRVAPNGTRSSLASNAPGSGCERRSEFA